MISTLEITTLLILGEESAVVMEEEIGMKGNIFSYYLHKEVYKYRNKELSNLKHIFILRISNLLMIRRICLKQLLKVHQFVKGVYSNIQHWLQQFNRKIDQFQVIVVNKELH